MSRITLFDFVLARPEFSGPTPRVFWDMASSIPPSGHYAVLFEVPGGLQPLLQNQDNLSKSVSVAVYRLPEPSLDLASIRAPFALLLEQLEFAVKTVNTDSDGRTPLTALHRSVSPPPMFDPVTRGYWATVRFQAQLLRR